MAKWSIPQNMSPDDLSRLKRILDDLTIFMDRAAFSDAMTVKELKEVKQTIEISLNAPSTKRGLLPRMSEQTDKMNSIMEMLALNQAEMKNLLVRIDTKVSATRSSGQSSKKSSKGPKQKSSKAGGSKSPASGSP